MEKSKSQLDLHQIIHDFYGDDASIFQDDVLLQDLMNNMLQKAHQRVVEQLDVTLKNHGIDEKLANLEFVVSRLDKRDADAKQRKEAAIAAARLASQQAKLPPGLSQLSLANYHSYQALLQEESELARQIADVEYVNRTLQETQENLSGRVQARVQEVQAVERDLEGSANMCTGHFSLGTE